MVYLCLFVNVPIPWEKRNMLQAFIFSIFSFYLLSFLDRECHMLSRFFRDLEFIHPLCDFMNEKISCTLGNIKNHLLSFTANITVYETSFYSSAL